MAETATLQSFASMIGAAEEIARRAMAKPCWGATRLIAIDGLGGAGKTTLARRVGDLTGGHVVHLDELGTWPDGPDITRLLREVVVPLGAGQDASYRARDWTAMQLGNWRSVPAGGVVLIEGSGSMSLEVAELLTFSVWLDCPKEIRLQRTLARDGKEVIDAWKHWTTWEAGYVATHQPRSRAELVVANDLPAT